MIAIIDKGKYMVTHAGIKDYDLCPHTGEIDLFKEKDFKRVNTNKHKVILKENNNSFCVIKNGRMQ